MCDNLVVPDEPPRPTAVTWAVTPEVPPEDTPPTTLDPADRYEDRGRIAVGGMGEVRRVFDRRLDCTVAMKVLARSLVDDTPARARFVKEGTITAQLHHPGIVAVHDRGEFADGQLWYTMSEVRGTTLDQHAPPGGPPDVRLRRWIEILLRVCDAMAYAHDQGVLHRDIKPENLMVGQFGEVMVMDWGIARRQEDAPEPPGSVLGTPHYMAPEQARGETSRHGPSSDVYALGVILYERLMGRTVLVGPSHEVVARHRQHAAAPFPDGRPAEFPPALAEIAEHALVDDPGGRTPDAGALAEQLRDWWTGAEQRARAEATLTEAMTLFPRIAELWNAADRHRRTARTLLGSLSVFARAEDKAPAWVEEDQAAARATEAAVLEADWLQRVGAALAQAPDLDTAHQALADHYATRLVEAEAARRPEEVARLEVHLARHDRGPHAALLRGTAAVTLVTDPPGANVRAFRFVEQTRRLTPVFERDLGTTPLHDVELRRGSWLLELDHPARPAVRYPILLARGEGWTGVPPGDSEPFAIVLPPESALGPDDVYVPAGWFVSGGDPEAMEPLPRRWLWSDALVVRRTPLTIETFMSLRDTDPSLAAARPKGPGWDDGVWVGDAEQLRWPIVGLTHAEARAVAKAEAIRTGQPWRLPSELEFEKYARGVDGRFYVWGDQHEPTWANILGHDPDHIDFTDVDTPASDESVYGVRGTVGNARDRCDDPWLPDGPPVDDLRLLPPQGPGELVTARGGSCHSPVTFSRLASRFGDPPDKRINTVGVRLVRSLHVDPPNLAEGFLQSRV